ncbi:MAG: WG repeat-containing protein [Zoogloeaceae bacterium]|nr:WG repeat-containing protein [Zoogloeaceae bacterium]
MMFKMADRDKAVRRVVVSAALTVLAVLCVLRLPEARAEQGTVTAVGEAPRQQGKEQVGATEYFWVVELHYDGAGDFVDGLAAVEVNGKWEVINEQGEEVISPRYDKVGYYSANGLVAVRVGDKWGYINKNGEEVIALRFDTANKKHPHSRGEDRNI